MFQVLQAGYQAAPVGFDNKGKGLYPQLPNTETSKVY